MKQFDGLIGGLLLIIGTAANAGIYRCEIDGVIVFSDTPCAAETSEPYLPGSSLSVVSVAEDMAETIERNRAWMEAEEARQKARREALAERRAQQPEPAPPARPAAASPFIALPYLGGPPPHAIDRRLERGQRDARRPEQAGEEPEERFSALRGRQPGSRRDP
jgi:hypothetical protein